MITGELIYEYEHYQFSDGSRTKLNEFSSAKTPNWSDVVDVSSGFGFVIGLQNNGSIVFVGKPSTEVMDDLKLEEITSWKDIRVP